METAAVSTLKARLSSFLARVKAGEEILVTERGRPVARIIPVRGSEQENDARVRDLERQGLLTRGGRQLSEGFWDLPLPPDPERSALRGLLEDRETGR